jgi:glycosyltransferase involved in cell wall biosynthesis
VSGRLVPPGDPEALAAALDAVLADPAAAEAMGRAARRRFEERFRAERMVRETEALYAALTAAGARGAVASRGAGA